MGNNKTIGEQALSYKSMSYLLRAQDVDHRFTGHKAKFIAPCNTIRCLVDHDDLEIYVKIPWLFRDMPNKARVELMSNIILRLSDAHAPRYGPRVRRFMKSDEFIMKYYYAVVLSGRKDMLSVPGMAIHRWWSKVNKFWRYFTTEQWLKCKTKTEIRSRIEPAPNMPVVTVDPVIRWVCVDPEVFFKELTETEREFLTYFACCVWVAYDADCDELDLGEIGKLVRKYPEAHTILTGLESAGHRLPLGFTSKNIFSKNKKKGKRTGSMFNNNERRVKTGLDFQARSAAVAYLLFKKLNKKVYKDIDDKTARDCAIASYVKTMNYMNGEDGEILIADKLGIKPDYYPWTEADIITYTFGFELVAKDVQLGVVKDMKLESKGTMLKISTDQFTMTLPINGLKLFVESMQEEIDTLCDEER